jgi:hypothetical protein
LSKRQKTDKTEFDGKLENKTTSLKTDVISEIEKTKKELQQENIKLDLKLIEVLENQLKGNKQSKQLAIQTSHQQLTIQYLSKLLMKLLESMPMQILSTQIARMLKH